jgi:hypothetical protein
MKNFSALVLFVLSVIVFVSCSKDDGTELTRQDILGTWNFVQLSANTEASVEASEDGYTEKIVTTSKYQSTNNKGTMTLTADEFITNGISYDATMDIVSKFYENGRFQDEIEYPQEISIPSSSSRTPYRLIGSDSLVMVNGAVVPSGQTVPYAGRLTLSGNDMTIRMRVTKDSSYQEFGVRYKIKEMADVSFLLRRP